MTMDAYRLSAPQRLALCEMHELLAAIAHHEFARLMLRLRR